MKKTEEVVKNKQLYRGSDNKRRDDGDKEKCKVYRSRFSEYTPLKTSREQILQECTSKEEQHFKWPNKRPNLVFNDEEKRNKISNEI